MGSSKVVTTPTVPHTMEHKKTIRSILTKTIKVIAPWRGHKEVKKQAKEEIAKETKEEFTKDVNREKIDVEKLIVDNFNKLMIEKEREDKNEVEEDDEFSYNTVKDDDDNAFNDEKKTERTDSHVSRDSGFSEKDCNDRETENVVAEDAKPESGKKQTGEDKSRVRSNSVGIGKISKSISDKEATSNKEEKISERVRTQSERSVISKEEEVVKSLSNLKIEDGKKKKLHTVAVSRGPVLNKRDYAATSHPYSSRTDAQGNLQQINQINTKTFSGGQVIYNTPRVSDFSLDTTEVRDALKSVQRNVLQNFPKNPEQQEVYLQLAEELIAEDANYAINEANVTEESIVNEIIELDAINESLSANANSIGNPLEELQCQMLDAIKESSLSVNANSIENPLEAFQYQVEFQNQENFINETQNSHALPAVNESDPIEEFYAHALFPNLTDSTNLDLNAELMGTDQIENGHFFPTPPRSENVPSPDSISSFYPSQSEYTLSPAMSSPSSNDYEKFQDISQYDDQMIPSFVSEHVDEITEKKEKARERNPSTSSSSPSSMNMKKYKDLQKELASGFSKKECCQAKRKSTKEIFCEHAQRLNMEDRKSIILKVASMELKQCYGTLQNILLKLQTILQKPKGSAPQPEPNKKLEKNVVMFRMICDRLLGENPGIFVGEDGLYLLLAASLRCPSMPLLTRYVVECVRLVTSKQPSLVTGDYVFTQVDAQRYNLVSACARVGDVCADVLFELVNRKPGEKPLFDVNHCNAEGNSALHVACKHHSGDNACLHVAHVLLEHGGADLWQGNQTAEDTALHLAVNSATCDLKMIMVLFKHEHRDNWYNLAHCPNRRYDSHHTKSSSVAPMDYARCAEKTRPDYPKEVLEFFKKCRKPHSNKKPSI